jgi:hypothetical protein
MAELITLDNEQLPRLVDGIKRFAVEFGIAGRPVAYVLFGNMLINEKQLSRDPVLLPKILNRHGRLVRAGLPFDCDRIETKSNARVFGLKHRGRRVTAKILMRYSGQTLIDRKYAGALFGEVRARRLAAPALAATGRLFAPRVIAYDRAHGRWIVEEHVEATAAERADIIEAARQIDIGALYKPSARLKPVHRRPPTRELIDLLAEIDPSFPQPPAGALWPEGLTHRDLPGNVLRTPDNRLCVIDWEMAKVAPVAADLVGLHALDPTLKPRLVAALQMLDPEGAALPPLTQLAVAYMRTAVPVWEKGWFIDSIRKATGMGHAEAIAEHATRVRTIREHLASLREA